jgi:hypothetical protein
MAHNFRYDVFVAYASPDAQYAEQLYALLSAMNWRVFLDSKVLVGGDPWPKVVREAQRDSLLTLILISERVDSAYFQREEILTAIDLAGEDRRRVVPLYLPGRRGRASIITPFKQLQGIFWEKGASVLTVATKIEDARSASRGQQDWLFEITRETIIIVTGCYNLAEIFDRPTAYELDTAIHELGRLNSRKFLRSIVLGDLWFIMNHSNVQDHPNVISIGAFSSNGLTRIMAGSAKSVKQAEDGRWQILREGNRWALFGNLAEDTYDAVFWFKNHELLSFVDEVWSHV